jgi:Fis family transcriptional regulator
MNSIDKDSPQKMQASSAARALIDPTLAQKLDKHSFESVVEAKISRFLDQIGTYYPENLYKLIMNKAEKPLLNQILKRTGGNQVHAAKILGINRNTLRKKMKLYGFS